MFMEPHRVIDTVLDAIDAAVNETDGFSDLTELTFH